MAELMANSRSNLSLLRDLSAQQLGKLPDIELTTKLVELPDDLKVVVLDCMDEKRLLGFLWGFIMQMTTPMGGDSAETSVISSTLPDEQAWLHCFEDLANKRVNSSYESSQIQMLLLAARLCILRQQTVKDNEQFDAMLTRLMILGESPANPYCGLRIWLLIQLVYDRNERQEIVEDMTNNLYPKMDAGALWPYLTKDEKSQLLQSLLKKLAFNPHQYRKALQAADIDCPFQAVEDHQQSQLRSAEVCSRIWPYLEQRDREQLLPIIQNLENEPSKPLYFYPRYRAILCQLLPHVDQQNRQPMLKGILDYLENPSHDVSCLRLFYATCCREWVHFNSEEKQQILAHMLNMLDHPEMAVRNIAYTACSRLWPHLDKITQAKILHVIPQTANEEQTDKNISELTAWAVFRNLCPYLDEQEINTRIPLIIALLEKHGKQAIGLCLDMWPYLDKQMRTTITALLNKIAPSSADAIDGRLGLILTDKQCSRIWQIMRKTGRYGGYYHQLNNFYEKIAQQEHAPTLFRRFLALFGSSSQPQQQAASSSVTISKHKK